MGNIVAEPVGGANRDLIKLLAIDFEKSDVLRGVSRFILATHDPRDLFPTAELGDICRELPFPADTCARIANVTRVDTQRIITEVETSLASIATPSSSSTTDHIMHRAQQIDSLVREVWNA